MVGLGPRDAAPRPARFPQARGRRFSRQIRSTAGSTHPPANAKCDHRDRHFHRRRPGPDRQRVRRNLVADCRPGYRRRRLGSRPRRAQHRCARPDGAAGHRRSAWRCVRAADDAARRGRFPDRRRARRQRPAGDQQRHHHGVSRHDLVVGAGLAQRRQCAAACWRRSKRCGRSSPPTPASICATRPTISMPKPRSAQWLVGRPRRSVRLQRSHGRHGCRSGQAAKAQPHGRAHRAFQRGIRPVGRARGVARPRRAGIDRPAGRGRPRGQRADALA